MSAPGAERLAAALSGGGGQTVLVPYLTAGFPTQDVTADLLLVAERCGCAAAEVGIPFSDPLADGPTIQRSSFRALSSGMTTAGAIEAVRRARSRGLTIPVVFMTYINPVLAHGAERFAADAIAAGADGVIVPDLPVDESGPLRSTLAAHDLALIPLVAPTTPLERLRRICDSAAGFVYCVGVTGVTGARDAVAPDALRLLDDVRRCTMLPRALGFGLKTHEHLKLLAGRAEAAVVGSALIDAIDAEPADPCRAATRFLTGMLGTERAATA